MRRSDTGDLWWKNAVFYCADVETFYDWNGDGCGDMIDCGTCTGNAFCGGGGGPSKCGGDITKTPDGAAP